MRRFSEIIDMLINLTIQNWMSYKDDTRISLVASREQQHGKTLAVISRLKARLLPIAMVFGGNASGKTNFFKSLAFCKSFIKFGMQLQPDEPINVEPFRLDRQSANLPTEFKFSILVGNDAYDYSFAVTRRRVVRESFVRRTSPSKDLSYAREWIEESDGYKYTFGKALDPDRALAELISKSTRENQLFLSVATAQNLIALLPVYNWFSKTLQLVSPMERYTAIERYADKSWPSSDRITEMLKVFGTGIAEIKRTPIQKNEIPIDPVMLDDLIRQTREGMTLRVNKHDETLPYLISRNNGELKFEKLTACHRASGGDDTTAEFELTHESEGTQRILDLLPAFAELENNANPKVYVIDEIDRQLHTMASQRLLRLFLDSRSNDSRSQILATTHDLLLMDQELLRRDEMWLADRDTATEISRLTSVNSFPKTRKSQELCGYYLAGRMGGIPSIIREAI